MNYSNSQRRVVTVTIHLEPLHLLSKDQKRGFVTLAHVAPPGGKRGSFVLKLYVKGPSTQVEASKH